MRKWQEVKKDNPFMASEREHAQSKFTCIAQEESVNILSDIVLIVSIVSGNQIIWCYYHLHSSSDVQEAVSGTTYFLWHTGQQAAHG
jgi:hypothetical protein